MNPYRLLLTWLCRAEIERVMAGVASDLSANKVLAYQAGFCEGELWGQQRMAEAMMAQCAARNGTQVEEGDVAGARRGMVH